MKLLASTYLPSVLLSGIAHGGVFLVATQFGFGGGEGALGTAVREEVAWVELHSTSSVSEANRDGAQHALEPSKAPEPPVNIPINKTSVNTVVPSERKPPAARKAAPQKRAELSGGHAPADIGNTAGNGATGATGGAPEGEARGIQNGYLRIFTEWLAMHRRYPSSARRRGLQGDVLTRVKLTKEGAVQEATVQLSSGHPLLDESALRMVWDATPFPPPPISGDEVELVVPIRFLLKASS